MIVTTAVTFIVRNIIIKLLISLFCNFYSL